MLLQDEYQMFSDEYIPVEETLAVLLRMFAAQPRGPSLTQEIPCSSTRPDLVDVDAGDIVHLDSNQSPDIIQLDVASPAEVIKLQDYSRGVITLDYSSDEEIVCLD